MCTVGQINAAPGASNVIAGLVNFTVDIRARRDSVREGALCQPPGTSTRVLTKRLHRRRRSRHLQNRGRVQRTQPRLRHPTQGAWLAFKLLLC